MNRLRKLTGIIALSTSLLPYNNINASELKIDDDQKSDEISNNDKVVQNGNTTRNMWYKISNKLMINIPPLKFNQLGLMVRGDLATFPENYTFQILDESVKAQQRLDLNPHRMQYFQWRNKESDWTILEDKFYQQDAETDEFEDFSKELGKDAFYEAIDNLELGDYFQKFKGLVKFDLVLRGTKRTKKEIELPTLAKKERKQELKDQEAIVFRIDDSILGKEYELRFRAKVNSYDSVTYGVRLENFKVFLPRFDELKLEHNVKNRESNFEASLEKVLSDKWWVELNSKMDTSQKGKYSHGISFTREMESDHLLTIKATRTKEENDDKFDKTYDIRVEYRCYF